MIPVMLITPDDIMEIEVSPKSLPAIRALAETGADTTEYCEIAFERQIHQNVPKAAINQIMRMHQVGALL